MEVKERAAHLKTLIVNDKHIDAINEILELLEASGGEGKIGLHVLLYRKKNLDKRSLKGTISHEEAGLESNKITEALISYVEKIERGEKITFDVYFSLKDVVKHDRRIFKKIFKSLDLDFINRLRDEVAESGVISGYSKKAITEFCKCIEDPSNGFLTESIAKGVNEVFSILSDINSIMNFIKEYKEGDSYNFTKAILAGNEADFFWGSLFQQVTQAAFENVNKTLNENIDKLRNVYVEFRKEVKLKLII